MSTTRRSDAMKASHYLTILVRNRDKQEFQDAEKRRLFEEILIKGSLSTICEAISYVPQVELFPDLKNLLISKILDSQDFYLYRRLLYIESEGTLSREIREEIGRRILASRKRKATVHAAGCLIFCRRTDFSDKLWMSLIRQTHSLWRRTREAKQIIESFFGDNYIVDSRAGWRGRAFLRVDRIPVFMNREWEVFGVQERSEKPSETLLGCTWKDWLGRPIIIRVLLVRDRLGSYAYQVDPQAETVMEAIAFLYGLDPAKFQGFTQET